jgi:hypothetical protein
VAVGRGVSLAVAVGLSGVGTTGVSFVGPAVAVDPGVSEPGGAVGVSGPGVDVMVGSFEVSVGPGGVPGSGVDKGGKVAVSSTVGSGVASSVA